MSRFQWIISIPTCTVQFFQVFVHHISEYDLKMVHQMHKHCARPFWVDSSYGSFYISVVCDILFHTKMILCYLEDRASIVPEPMNSRMRSRSKTKKKSNCGTQHILLPWEQWQNPANNSGLNCGSRPARQRPSLSVCLSVCLSDVGISWKVRTRIQSFWITLKSTV